MNFMNLPKKYAGKDSRYLVLPIEYEKDVTGRKGCSKAPWDIIKSSYQLEYYDETAGQEIFENGIKILPAAKTHKNVESRISGNHERFIVSLGGDHSVTIPILKAFESSGRDDFSVILLDAHADLFDSWNGSKHNHRCVSKYASYKHDVAILGLRSLDREEARTIRDSENVHAVFASEDVHKKALDVLSRLKKDVYLSIDVDVFDPSFIRNTGTPEPGGFFWNDILRLLKMIFETKNVISADIVEFSPSRDSGAESYSLAKLAHKLMALKESSLHK